MKLKEAELRGNVLLWLSAGDTGSSSKCMAFTLLGIPAEPHHPLDGSDLGRCIRLLRMIPALRPRLKRVRVVSEQWARIVDHWAELETLYEEDERHWPVESPKPTTPRTYARMKELRL